MVRFTVKRNDKYVLTDPANEQKALSRLGKFENIWERLSAEQEELSQKMEQLRKDNKVNSVQFKELLVKKLTNTNILGLFEVYGIK